MTHETALKDSLFRNLPDWLQPLVESSKCRWKIERCNERPEWTIKCHHETPKLGDFVRSIFIYPTNGGHTTVLVFNQKSVKGTIARLVTLGGSETFVFSKRHSFDPYRSKYFVDSVDLQPIIDKVSKRAFSILMDKPNDFRTNVFPQAIVELVDEGEIQESLIKNMEEIRWIHEQEEQRIAYLPTVTETPF